VGDSVSPSLLFPTKAFVKTTGLCQLEGEFVLDSILSPCSNVNPTTAWNLKLPVVYWRGSPTGIPLDADHEFFLARTAFNRRFHSAPGYDIAFALDAIPPYRPDAFIKRHKWGPRIPKQDYGLYKYLMSMDGHTASWGLIERLATGSLVFKQDSPFREHYYRLLVPYEHFIPVDKGFTNLESARLWALENDKKAGNIAQNALNLLKTRMRTQDVWCYVFRLIYELSLRINLRDDKDVITSAFEWREINEADVAKRVKY